MTTTDEHTLSSFWRHKRSSDRPIALRDLQVELTYLARLILNDNEVQVGWHKDLLSRQVDRPMVYRNGQYVLDEEGNYLPAKTIILDSSPIDDIPEGQPIPDDRVDALVGDTIFRAHLEGLSRNPEFAATRQEVKYATGELTPDWYKLNPRPRSYESLLMAERDYLASMPLSTDLNRIVSIVEHLRSYYKSMDTQAPAVRQYVNDSKAWKKDKLKEVIETLNSQVADQPYLDNVLDLWALFLIYDADLSIDIPVNILQAMLDAQKSAFDLMKREHPSALEVLRYIRVMAESFKSISRRPTPPPQGSGDGDEDEGEEGNDEESEEGDGQDSPDGTDKPNEGEEPEGGPGDEHEEGEDTDDDNESEHQDNGDQSGQDAEPDGDSNDQDASSDDKTSDGESGDDTGEESASDGDSQGDPSNSDSSSDELEGDDEDGPEDNSEEFDGEEGMDSQGSSGSDSDSAEGDSSQDLEDDDSDWDEDEDEDYDDEEEGADSSGGSSRGRSDSPPKSEADQILDKALSQSILDVVDQISSVAENEIEAIRSSIEFEREDITDEVGSFDHGQTMPNPIIWEKVPYNADLETRLRNEAYQSASGITNILSRFKRMRSRTERSQESGFKLDQRRLGRVLYNDMRVFQRRTIIDKLDMTLVLLLDSSSSLNDNQWNLIVKTAAAFIQALSHRDDVNLIVESYTTSGYENKVTRHYDRRMGKFAATRPYEGGTPSGMALAAIRESIFKRLRVHTRDKIVVHLTDGEPNEWTTVKEQVELNHKAGIETFCVLVQGDTSGLVSIYGPSYAAVLQTRRDEMTEQFKDCYGKNFQYLEGFDKLLPTLTALFSALVEVR